MVRRRDLLKDLMGVIVILIDVFLNGWLLMDNGTLLAMTALIGAGRRNVSSSILGGQRFMRAGLTLAFGNFDFPPESEHRVVGGKQSSEVSSTSWFSHD